MEGTTVILQRAPHPGGAGRAGVQTRLPAKVGMRWASNLSVTGFENKTVLTLRAQPGMRGPQKQAPCTKEGHCSVHGDVEEVVLGPESGQLGR